MPTPRQLGVIALALAAVLTPSSLMVGCGGGSTKRAGVTTTTTATTTSTSTSTTSTTTTLAPTTTVLPPSTTAPYQSSIDTVTAADLGASWHEGCPVAPSQLRMVTVTFAGFDGDDFETPDDNSTGFSCRDAVNDSGTAAWSEHAFGHAIDINPIENPYVEGDRIIPSSGAAYTDRSDVRPGMAVTGSAIVKAFSAIGWGWGASFEDYQHFSTNGR